MKLDVINLLMFQDQDLARRGAEISRQRGSRAVVVVFVDFEIDFDAGARQPPVQDRVGGQQQVLGHRGPRGAGGGGAQDRERRQGLGQSGVGGDGIVIAVVVLVVDNDDCSC